MSQSQSVLVALANGRGHVQIDAGDAVLVSQFKWSLAGNGYATARVGGRVTYLHRLVMGQQLADVPGKWEVDHQNRDKLDNRKCNLRISTHSENMGNMARRRDNRSGCKGVSWEASCNKWRASIGYQGRREYLGVYPTVEDAARAYDDRAKELFGEFARVNFAQNGHPAHNIC